MSIIEFTAEVFLISASAVLFPDLLFLANLIYGSKGGLHSGIEISVGHTIVELPLFACLFCIPAKLPNKLRKKTGG